MHLHVPRCGPQVLAALRDLSTLVNGHPAFFAEFPVAILWVKWSLCPVVQVALRTCWLAMSVARCLFSSPLVDCLGNDVGGDARAFRSSFPYAGLEGREAKANSLVFGLSCLEVRQLEGIAISIAELVRSVVGQLVEPGLPERRRAAQVVFSSAVGLDFGNRKVSDVQCAGRGIEGPIQFPIYDAPNIFVGAVEMLLAVGRIHAADGVCGVGKYFKIVRPVPLKEGKVNGPGLGTRDSLFAGYS